MLVFVFLALLVLGVSMIFSHDKPIEALLDFGLVATLRDYPYKVGSRVKVKVKDVGVVYGRIEDVIERPSRIDLEIYVHISGFDSVKKWVKTARELHGKKPKYLVVVSVPKQKLREMVRNG